MGTHKQRKPKRRRRLPYLPKGEGEFSSLGIGGGGHRMQNRKTVRQSLSEWAASWNRSPGGAFAT